MFSVRQRSEASFLGTHAQVRETNCLDGCDRSRGQEPLRAGGGPLAAFKRRLQANARADAHLAGLAKAMTSTPEIAIEVVRIDPACLLLDGDNEGRYQPGLRSCGCRSRQWAPTQFRKWVQPSITVSVVFL
jgi:hypothetical protein